MSRGTKNVLRLALAALWGALIAAVGICLTATIVGAPIGIPLIMLSGRPFAKTYLKIVKEGKK